MFNNLRKLFSRKPRLPAAIPPEIPDIPINIRLSDYPAALELSQSPYAIQFNHHLVSAMETIESLQGRTMSPADAQPLIHDAARLCDLALFELNTRHQHYTIIIGESRKLLDSFIDTFKELYEKSFLEKIDERIEKLVVYINERKLTLMKGTSIWGRILNWTGKLAREAIDSFKNLLSFIRILGVKSDYSRMLDEYLGEGALRKLHTETVESIQPEIERRLKEQIDHLVRELPRVTMDCAINTPTPTETISSSLKVSGFTMLMSGAGTMVLTAGWHTIAWSTLNLLLPMVIYLVLPGALIAMIGLQNRDQEKKKEALQEAKTAIHNSIHEHTILELAERIRAQYRHGEADRERELILKIFPRLENDSISTVRRAMKDLNAIIERLHTFLDGAQRDNHPGEMLGRCSHISMSNPLEDSLLLAACFDSLTSFCNRKHTLGGNTLRDGGTAGIIAQLKERGLIDENQFNTLTSARRVRNRLAHHVHDFMRLPESQQKRLGKTLLAGIRELGPLVKDESLR